MSSHARRNTYTTVLFLVGIFAAMIFIGLGALPKASGFLKAARPEKRYVPQLSRPAATASAVVKHPHALPLPRPSLPDWNENTQRLTDAEPAVNQILDRNHTFIELYGGVQRLMGRRVVEDAEPKYTVVRLTDQVLTFANPEAQYTDMTTRGREMAEFAHRVEEELELPFLYIQAPGKTSMASLPKGMNDYSDAEADQFLSILKEEKVDTLDLRPAFLASAEEGLGLEELFFPTDHHWTPAGAFTAFQSVCEKLSEDYDFTIFDEITDPHSYSVYTFEDVFLGSQGKRVGSLYAGVDDIQIWSPNFQTDFTYTVPLAGISRRGTFVTSLLFPEMLTDTDLYTANPYVIYSGGDHLLSRAVNEKSPYATRFLVLRDSYGCAFTPFLSLISGEVMAVDPRQFDGDQEEMMDYIKWLDPDMILVLNTTSSLRVDKLYPYLPSARSAALADARAEDFS